MVLVCVPIPGKEIVKSAEHVSDVDADYKPPPLPFFTNTFFYHFDQRSRFLKIDIY